LCSEGHYSSDPEPVTVERKTSGKKGGVRLVKTTTYRCPVCESQMLRVRYYRGDN
jgi:hypothetical protein